MVGFEGCTDNDYAVRLLLSLIRHPNIGAVLAVGLGCEYIQAGRLAEQGRRAGKPAEWILIQEEGGTSPSIEKGLELVQRFQKQIEQVPQAEMGFSDLVIGAECGGSDSTSGLAGNAVVGRMFDKIADCGGTAVFEEIVEAVGLVDFLTSRAVNDRVRGELSDTYHKAMQYCRHVKQYSISPGNFVGGLSTIEEKSMGALIKSGSRPIQGVIKTGQKPNHAGLWLLDSTPDPYWMEFGYTNPNDNEGLMALISCGCQMTYLVTGRGNVVGSAVAPVLKITGNTCTYQRMNGDMDFNAGAVLTGECSLEQLTGRLAEQTAAVCGGRQTKGEALGHKEYMIPYKYQEPEARVRPCEGKPSISG